MQCKIITNNAERSEKWLRGLVELLFAIEFTKQESFDLWEYILCKEIYTFSKLPEIGGHYIPYYCSLGIL